ncbi:DUF2269 family protein [Acuticoccus sp. MNP-M23]|uniref:DUF2269 family protein n=1 Tax=Acuticoccus sp. MNP-M23 TaxID=3072793 RepID=UPI002814D3FF|nr:DUF2269 family protein [Acuticoccus sp. MNP-M23]WMS41958.1 DUF2269 family protein [Acuticoccus sp. MNP-M23]
MRKTVKILHSIAACGLIGGIMSYMVLLVVAAPATADGFVQLRSLIAAVSNYVLLPSLAVGLVSGLLSMIVHRPFLEKGWVWLKAALGILMFKGVLTIIGAKADYAADLAAKIAAGTASPERLERMLTLEWYTLIVVLAVAVANIVLGVWRPGLKRRVRRRVPDAATAEKAGGRSAEMTMPAAAAPKR